MNYYQHHIGDYATATKHLSLIEDAIYMRLLWAYYRDEKPLPNDLNKVAWMVGVRTKKEKTALVLLLETFFVLQADGWHNSRADEEIAHYRKSQNKGKAGANARWGSKEAEPEQSAGNASSDATLMQGKCNFDATDMQSQCNTDATHMPDGCTGNANQQPITNTSLSNDREEIYVGTLQSDNPRDGENATVASPAAPPEPDSAPDPKPASKTRRGTCLPDDWQLPKSWGEWALQKCPDMTAEGVRHQAERFADYWHAKTGKDASKADWEATWRNWIRDTKAPLRPQTGSLHTARSPPDRRSRYAEEAREIAEMAAQAKARLFNQKAAVIDMGVIDATVTA